MKKVFFAIIFIFLLATVSYAADINLSVEASDGREFQSDINRTLFLPSYIDVKNVTVKFDDNNGVTYSSADGGEKTSVKSGDSIDIRPFKTEDGIYKIIFYTDNMEYTYIFYVSSSLPSIHISTSLGKDSILRDNNPQIDNNVKISIIDKNGQYEYRDTANTYGQLKVRGNATNAYAKKPFQMKLYQKKSLFGMEKAKTWILLANYIDQSLIRNMVMYEIGNLLGMDNCKFQSVDLYLDGEYCGVYLLCEKVQIGENRINIRDLEKETDALNQAYGSARTVNSGQFIDKGIITEYRYVEGVVNPADITGGYLVELDNNYGRNEKCYFITKSGNCYVVKSPENVSKEQMEYIAAIFGYMEQALSADDGISSENKHYSEYIDADSLVYAYIAAEFGRNYDAGSSSTYFYKDADINGTQRKITAGPLWDCDNTLGNILKYEADNQNGYWAGRSERRFWKECIKHEDFNALVKTHFERIYDNIFDMVDAGGFIERKVKEIGTSIKMERAVWNSNDYSEWPLYYSGIHYDRWQTEQVFNFIENYSDGIDADSSTVIGYLCNCIVERTKWFVQEWQCDVTERQRVLNSQPPIDSPDTEDTDTNTDTTNTDTTNTDATNTDATNTDATNTDTTNSDTTNSDTNINTSSADTATDSSNVDTSIDTNNEETRGEETKNPDDDTEHNDITIVVTISVALAVILAAIVFVIARKKK